MSSSNIATAAVPASTSTPIGRYRWIICAMLFLATTINYMDRSVIGVLAPTLQYRVFHWTDLDYSYITISFMVAYAGGMVFMGSIIDKLGTRFGYTLAIGIWSICGMLHAAVRPAFSLVGFSLARFGLAFGESGNFPAAIKTVAEWFPKKERAFATGIFNAGSNVGAIMAPLIIPLIVAPDGTNWQFAFLTTGFFSLVWVIAWNKIYRRPEVHPKLGKAELAYIQSDSAPETTDKLPWRKVIPRRETWAFAIGKITDAAWWFYLFWGGKFLYDEFGLNIKEIAVPLIIIYVLADVGSIAGGWVSSNLIKRGWTVNRARKTTMAIFACMILPVMFSTQLGTKFAVNDSFFSRVQAATYTAEQTSTVGGETRFEKVAEHVPAEVLASLHSLDGQSFSSAKEFLGAARTAVAGAKIGPMESVLIDSARSDSMYWIAVILIAIAASAHQGWSCNLFTLVSDVFPKKATASVTGFGGMIGGVASIIANFTLGSLLTSSGPAGYFFAFLGAGSCYLIILLIVHLLMPKMTPLGDNLEPVTT